VPTFKVFIVSLPESGKTEFIKSVSDFPLVSIEKKIVSTGELVDMDYGRVYSEGSMVYLYASVRDQRYDFLWASLNEDMHGFILLVDATRLESIQESEKLYKILLGTREFPHVIAIGKADLATEDHLRDVVQRPLWANQIVLPCNCTSKLSVDKVVDALNARMLQRYRRTTDLDIARRKP
jgi:signal recognition particle receptor subunit beta